MAQQRIHKLASSHPPQLQSQGPEPAPQRFAPQARYTPAAAEEGEHEEFDRDKFEAFGLELRQRNGGITPEETERLGVLQAKMNDFWAGQRAGETAVRLPPALPAENETGMPDALKAGIERLSGLAMDDVRVHRDSAKPARIQALAYTQGTQIHLAPGQDRHLPHEAWHVVQQKQGRVAPTLQARGFAINDEAGLEQEADALGAKAASLGGTASASPAGPLQSGQGSQVIQGYFSYNGRRMRNVTTEMVSLFQGVAGFMATLEDYRAKRTGEEEFPFMPWFQQQLEARGWQDTDIVERGEPKISVSEFIGNLADGAYEEVAAPEPEVQGRGLKRKTKGDEGPAASQGIEVEPSRVQSAQSKVPSEILEALQKRPKRTVWSLEKSQMELACWNWALNALGPVEEAVDPQLISSYLAGMWVDLGKLVGALSGELKARLDTLRDQLRAQRMTMSQLFARKPKKYKDYQLEGITEMGRIIVEANGFTLAAREEAEAEIVLQYKLKDGVSWEHWWIELLGGDEPVIIGTDSGRRNLEVDDDEAHMTGGAPDEGFGVVRYPVSGLKKGHISALEAIVNKHNKKAKKAEPASQLE